jgi:hypothetical protein
MPALWMVTIVLEQLVATFLTSWSLNSSWSDLRSNDSLAYAVIVLVNNVHFVSLSMTYH